jgi:hypothetical protein
MASLVKNHNQLIYGDDEGTSLEDLELLLAQAKVNLASQAVHPDADSGDEDMGADILSLNEHSSIE